MTSIELIFSRLSNFFNAFLDVVFLPIDLFIKILKNK